MDNKLREALVEYGQYRDVFYIREDGEVVETRCLVIPAKIVEPLIEE